MSEENWVEIFDSKGKPTEEGKKFLKVVSSRDPLDATHQEFLSLGVTVHEHSSGELLINYEYFFNGESNRWRPVGSRKQYGSYGPKDFVERFVNNTSNKANPSGKILAYLAKHKIINNDQALTLGIKKLNAIISILISEDFDIKRVKNNTIEFYELVDYE